ncbi:hypothetical protein HaLaN_26962 [Haematococcus lacustris]|uniref:Uncharacterized protein n=1 Tax=Haematococcus lacustris TaxID=44745 RepID=A0A6A0A7C9_HAELA|nr:hypothetical protein HaLaN_26962 [Haematococcus lacustris]
MKAAVLQVAGPTYTSQEQHGSHALKLPPPSEALAKQLSQSQRSVPGSQLQFFVSALDSDKSLKVKLPVFNVQGLNLVWGKENTLQSAGDKLHALAVISYGYLAQALCDVLGHQEEAYALKELITTCQDEGIDL